MKLYGFYSPCEVYADNRDIYRSRFALPSGAIRENIARINLEFLERFNPRIPHERRIAHTIEIYEIVEYNVRKRRKTVSQPFPLSSKKKEFLVVCASSPQTRVKIYKADIGELVQNACNEEMQFIHEVLDPKCAYVLDDGTEIHGERKKMSPFSGPPHARILQNQFIRVCFDVSGLSTTRNWYYKAEIVKEPFRAKKLEIHVVQYVAVDGIRVAEKECVIRGAYEYFSPNVCVPGSLAYLVENVQ